MLLDSNLAAVVAGLLAVGLYKAFRFLPESVAEARPTPDAAGTTERRVDLILGELGRTVAAGLGAALASISLLAMMVAPLAAGLALFGFLAPFAGVLALVTVGSPSGGAGCTLRGLRAVIAATFGLTVFLGLTFGVAPALAPGCAGLVLMALDPTLGVASLALGGRTSDD